MIESRGYVPQTETKEQPKSKLLSEIERLQKEIEKLDAALVNSMDADKNIELEDQRQRLSARRDILNAMEVAEETGSKLAVIEAGIKAIDGAQGTDAKFNEDLEKTRLSLTTQRDALRASQEDRQDRQINIEGMLAETMLDLNSADWRDKEAE